MELILIGINQKTAPLDIRGKIVFKKNHLDKVYKFFINQDFIEEIIIVSTCNRTEFYIIKKQYLNIEIKKIVKDFLKEFCNLNFDLDSYLYFKENKIALEHLCNVVSGIDSQVLGEKEILNQVKDVLIESRKYLKNEELNYLFKQAMDIGNYVRFNTDISFGNLSFASISIDLIKKEFKTIENKKIIVIGTGKVSSDIAQNLRGLRIKPTFIANRHFLEANVLAKITDGEARRLEDLDSLIKNSDAIISCTSSPHIILTKKDIIRFRKLDKKLLLIDLACPRDIEKGLNYIENIIHYDLDNLINFTNETLEIRKKSINLAKEIIKEKMCALELEPVLVG